MEADYVYEQERRQVADDAALWASKASVDDLRGYLGKHYVRQIAEHRPATARLFVVAQRLLFLLEQKGSA